ncbi:MAG: hypothetical protein K6E29_06310 [Cyanobacteria bacterium RUI128]|nr:hypothetical protein [Cyanobacteria bacterium RUI128]
MIKLLMFDLKKSEEEYLREIDTSDFEITCFKNSLDKETKLTVKQCDETGIISVFVNSKLTSEVLNKFKNLRIIVTRSVCFEHIDINECRRRNIAVINVNEYAREAISQYVIGLIFAMSRNIVLANNDVKNRINSFEKYESENINKLSLGVIGTGSVGSAVCELAHKLGMKIYANDFIKNKNISDYTEYLSINDVLRKSDIITLHLPYDKELYKMISKKEFEIMKEGSFLINTCDYRLVDIPALYKAVKNNKLKGAALDIIIDNDDIFSNKKSKKSYEDLENYLILNRLIQSDRVIITPQIAYDTRECLTGILDSNFRDIKDYYVGRKTNRVV